MRLQATLARFSLSGALLALAAGSGACSSDSPLAAGSGGAQAGSAGASPAGAPMTAGSSSSGAGQAGVSGAGTTSGGNTTGATAGNGSGGATAGNATGGSNGGAGNAGLAGAAGETEVLGPFKLTSPVVTEGATIDVKFRCTGDNVTPALDWTRGPPATLSYAVTQIHVGSQSVHWVLWDIPAALRMLPEHIVREAMPATPAGTKQVKPNIDGATWYGYTGPCPGGANQSYTFSVHALDVATLPGITPESTSTAAMATVKAHQLAVASITVMASK